MNKTFVVPVAADTHLEELRLIIEQRENRIGRLIAISPYQGHTNWLTFAFDTPPGRAIRLDLIGPAAAPAISNFDLVCVGDCLIEDAIKTIAVYRAN